MKKDYLIAGVACALGFGAYLVSPRRSTFQEASPASPSLEQACVGDAHLSTGLAGLVTPPEVSSTSGERSSPSALEQVQATSDYRPAALPSWMYGDGEMIGELSELLRQAVKDIDWKHPNIPPGPVRAEYFMMQRGNYTLQVRPVSFSDGQRDWMLNLQPHHRQEGGVTYDGSMVRVHVDNEGKVTEIDSSPVLRFCGPLENVSDYVGQAVGDAVSIIKTENGFKASSRPLMVNMGSTSGTLEIIQGEVSTFNMHKNLPWAFQDLATTLQEGYQKTKK
jgi:hypothetical protein